MGSRIIPSPFLTWAPNAGASCTATSGYIYVCQIVGQSVNDWKGYGRKRNVLSVISAIILEFAWTQENQEKP
jgi:hypothetical protein